ncbi:MAG: efflux RND transporter periplasmic adaptor subunit [Bacteroidales bacterium]|nr:efflux RND transporter periplasmic adaptor subunit [Bacteroidales bacterium]MBN2820817.1 efflux RND transporter periplasmic adaptor subunit [Bacteroidales bacterium]
MKTLVRLLPVILIFACNPNKPDKELVELTERRDSLQAVQAGINKELIKIDEQIALLDTNLSDDDITTIKKITAQKNRISAIQVKIRKLEDKLSSAHNKDDVRAVAVKEMVGEPFDHYLISYGDVDASKYAKLSPEMNGRVEQIYVTEGQKIKKGELILSLNTSAIENQIKSVETSLELAKTTYEKQSTLYKQGIGSEIEYLGSKTNKESLEAQLDALQAQMRMSQLRAPFDGVVDQIYAKKGEMTSPMYPAVDFINLDKITIRSDISESYIGEVKTGDNVEITFAALPGFKQIAPIKFISKIIDPQSRTFKIEIELNNKADKIRPNMVSTIKVNDFSSENAMVVPSLVIRKDISGDYVYVVTEEDGKSRIAKKPIETSLSYEEKTLVNSGLVKGDKVVIEGYHLVSNGEEVKIVK